MGKMTVYHGSYTAIEKPSIIKGRNTKDFGIGFYCTLIREQAERWAKRYDTPAALKCLEYVTSEGVTK